MHLIVIHEWKLHGIFCEIKKIGRMNQSRFASSFNYLIQKRQHNILIPIQVDAQLTTHTHISDLLILGCDSSINHQSHVPTRTKIQVMKIRIFQSSLQQYRTTVNLKKKTTL